MSVSAAEVHGSILDMEKTKLTQTDNEQNDRANKVTGWQTGRNQVLKKKN